MGLPSLEATFETLVDAFVFLDKNKDGYVSKNEMIQAINETTTGERSSGRIAMKRFGQFIPPHPFSLFSTRTSACTSPLLQSIHVHKLVISGKSVMETKKF